MEVNTNEAAEEPVVPVTPESPQVDDAAAPAEVDVNEHPEMKALVASFSTAAVDTEVAESEDKPEAATPEGEPEAEVGKDAPAAEEPTAWITDSDRRYANALGVSAEELADFGSREELDRFGRILAARQTARVEKAEEPAKTAEYVDQPILADGTLNVEWFKQHEYDEGQIAMAQAAADKAKKLDEVEQKFEAIQGRMAEEQRHRDINDFHDALDNIDGEFFGKTIVKDATGAEKPVVISEKLGARRQAVFAQLDVAHESLSRRLGHAPSMSQKVELAAKLAWQSELAEVAAKRTAAAEKGKLTKIVKQAQKVRPVGSQAVSAGRSKNVDPDSVEAVTSNPEFVALMAKFNEHNAN